MTFRRRIVLVDIDHTLSDAAWRDDKVPGPDNSWTWDDYYSRQGEDRPMHDICHLVKCLRVGKMHVVGLTARPERYRKETSTWLRLHDAELDGLIMRPDENHESSTVLKPRMALEHFDPRHVAFVLEDRTDVAEAMVVAGYSVLQVRSAMPLATLSTSIAIAVIPTSEPSRTVRGKRGKKDGSSGSKTGQLPVRRARKE